MVASKREIVKLAASKADIKVLKMSNDEHWFSTVFAGFREVYPLVPAEAFDRIEDLLKGDLSERTLTPARLKTIAMELIEDIAPTSPKPEVKQ